MESIEPLSLRDIECYEEYDESWYDEKNLEEIHGVSYQLSGSGNQGEFFFFVIPLGIPFPSTYEEEGFKIS